MVLDFLLGGVASALEKFLSKLPAFDTNWPLADAFTTLSEILTLAWNLFPPISTLLLILAAGVAVEVGMLAWYWVNWFVKKIPGIS